MTKAAGRLALLTFASAVSLGLGVHVAAGTPGAGFGADGTRVLSSLDCGTCGARSIVVEPDGRIVVATAAAEGSGDNVDVFRLGADGATESFGHAQGPLRLRSATGCDAPALVRLGPEIVLACGSLLVKIGPDGVIEPEPVPVGIDLSAVAVAPDGAIVAGGFDAPGDAVLARVFADGAADPSFGAGGELVIPGSLLSWLGLNPGAPCTLVGTEGRDHLQGTPQADRICGLDGPDWINGGAGNDHLDGGPATTPSSAAPGTTRSSADPATMSSAPATAPATGSTAAKEPTRSTPTASMSSHAIARSCTGADCALTGERTFV